MQALLGQKLAGEVNLVAQILILIGLWIGFYFAHTKQFARHRTMQTSMVWINSFFILFVMVTSFYNNVIRGAATTKLLAGLLIIHGAFGLLAELTGIYLILRMNTSLIPPRLRLINYRLVMRSLLGLWTLVVIGGFGIYYALYLAPGPGPTTLPAAQLLQASNNLQIHAGEMKEALQRGSLSTARRHAEHLINLVEGKQGPDYGDADGDGIVEDPGDGIGAVVYLGRVLAESAQAPSKTAQATQIAGLLRSRMLQAAKDAIAVIHANDLSSVTGSIQETAALTEQIKNDPSGNVTQLLHLLNLPTTPSTGEVSLIPTGGQAVVVNLKDFLFSPQILKVKQGTTVNFVNEDPVKHTVTSDTGLFNSGDILPGKTFSYTFNQFGVFPYYCVFHGDRGGVDMAGRIEVEP